MRVWILHAGSVQESIAWTGPSTCCALLTHTARPAAPEERHRGKRRHERLNYFNLIVPQMRVLSFESAFFRPLHHDDAVLDQDILLAHLDKLPRTYFRIVTQNPDGQPDECKTRRKCAYRKMQVNARRPYLMHLH